MSKFSGSRKLRERRNGHKELTCDQNRSRQSISTYGAFCTSGQWNPQGSGVFVSTQDAPGLACHGQKSEGELVLVLLLTGRQLRLCS
jgi:hypothetical protein